MIDKIHKCSSLLQQIKKLKEDYGLCSQEDLDFNVLIKSGIFNNENIDFMTAYTEYLTLKQFLLSNLNFFYATNLNSKSNKLYSKQLNLIGNTF